MLKEFNTIKLLAVYTQVHYQKVDDELIVTNCSYITTEVIFE